MSKTQQDHPTGPHSDDDGLFYKVFRNSRAALLLAAMFLQILLAPIENTVTLMPLIMRELIILAAIFVASDNRKHLKTALWLGIPSLLLLVISHETETPVTDFIAYFMVVVLYIYVIRLILNQVFGATAVTVNTIAMALCCYMLLGQMWMMFYALVASLDPGAFTQPIVEQGSDAGLTLTYFSYVTLTTLGYGDISPVSPWARSLAILEALTGTMFIAVLISRLVGTYRSQAEQDKMKKLFGE